MKGKRSCTANKHYRIHMNNYYLEKYINIFKRYTIEELTEEQLETPMQELGISSFTVLEILIIIEDEFQIDFPDYLISTDLFFSPKTLFEGVMKVINANKKK